MVYKSLNGLALDHLSEMFVDRGSITNYALRDTGGKLALPQPRTNYLKNSFGYSGAALWNSLPAEYCYDRLALCINLDSTVVTSFDNC